MQINDISFNVQLINTSELDKLDQLVTIISKIELMLESLNVTHSSKIPITLNLKVQNPLSLPSNVATTPPDSGMINDVEIPRQDPYVVKDVKLFTQSPDISKISNVRNIIAPPQFTQPFQYTQPQYRKEYIHIRPSDLLDLRYELIKSLLYDYFRECTKLPISRSKRIFCEYFCPKHQVILKYASIRTNKNFSRIWNESKDAFEIQREFKEAPN